MKPKGYDLRGEQVTLIETSKISQTRTVQLIEVIKILRLTVDEDKIVENTSNN